MSILKKKSIICIVLMVLLLSAVPVAALAEEQEGTSEETSKATEKEITSLSTETTTPAAAAANAATIEEVPKIAVKAVADGRSRIKVSWQKVADSKGYAVYRSTSSKKLGSKVFETKKISVTKFTDKKATIKKKYYYTVKPRAGSEGISTLSLAAGKSKVVKNKLKVKKTFKVKAYAYSGGGYTASGKKAAVGRIAVDPRVIKLGTWLYVEGYGLAQACDVGGGIKGKKIDCYFNTVKQCYSWGVHKAKVYILK